MTAPEKTTRPDRWANPPTWPAWAAELHLEMERHDWPVGRSYDAESYRDFFDNGYGPHEAIEEDFNNG